MEIDDEADTVTLIWQTDHSLTQPASIFVHLLDDSGQLLNQVDGVPYDGLYPLPNWRPNHPFTDLRQLDGLSPTSNVSIGIYDPTTGQRLIAVDSAGNRLLNDALVVP